jgi:basic amino acid/polyamine antiporter, APA family
VYPTSGGTYVYGRERLGPWWGFTAGWGFVVGKTASCAAMALTFAAYAVPGHHWTQRLVGAVAVLALTAVNQRGVSRTATAAKVLVIVSLVCLGSLVIAVWASGNATHTVLPDPAPWGVGGPYGVLQAAGLLFFAFAGYARIATMGEEVRDPARTIPWAILLALGFAVVVYAVVGAAALAGAGADALAGAAAPLRQVLDSVDRPGLAPVVQVGGVVASLGALLSLIAGVGRTSLAMAREHDLPQWLAAVHPRFAVPHHAETALAVVVCLLVMTVDLRGVIGFSSFGVLVYYAVANLSALTQPAGERHWPRGLHVAGALLCVVLVTTLPWQSDVAGLVMFAIGLGGRLVVQTRRSR